MIPTSKYVPRLIMIANITLEELGDGPGKKEKLNKGTVRGTLWMFIDKVIPLAS